MTSALQSIANRLRNVFHESVLFLTETEKAQGIQPQELFKTMTQVYLGDLAAKANIDLLADKVALRFYTTMNSDYTETSDGKTAKEVVDEWCRTVGFDQVLQLSARYLIGWGNIFWWIGNPVKVEFLAVLPGDIIKQIRYDREGPQLNNYRITQVDLDWKHEPKTIPGEELIHVAYNPITSSPIGVGILQSLCTPLEIGNGETREPFYQIKGKIHSGMADTIYTFGAPNELWSFPGLSKDKLLDAQSQVRSIPRRGARFVYNPPAGSEAKVTSVVAERMRGLDYYAEMLDDEYNLGLQSALNRLISKRGYTEASSKEAMGVTEDRVYGFQQFLKRTAEAVFDRVVAQAGLDPVQAEVRLNWGMPESLDYEKLSQILDQVTELLKVNPSIIGTMELRKILREVAKLPLEEGEPEVPSQVLEVEKQIERKTTLS